MKYIKIIVMLLVVMQTFFVQAGDKLNLGYQPGSQVQAAAAAQPPAAQTKRRGGYGRKSGSTAVSAVEAPAVRLAWEALGVVVPGSGTHSYASGGGGQQPAALGAVFSEEEQVALAMQLSMQPQGPARQEAEDLETVSRRQDAERKIRDQAARDAHIERLVKDLTSDGRFSYETIRDLVSKFALSYVRVDGRINYEYTVEDVIRACKEIADRRDVVPISDEFVLFLLIKNRPKQEEVRGLLSVQNIFQAKAAFVQDLSFYDAGVVGAAFDKAVNLSRKSANISVYETAVTILAQYLELQNKKLYEFLWQYNGYLRKIELYKDLRENLQLYSVLYVQVIKCFIARMDEAFIHSDVTDIPVIERQALNDLETYVQTLSKDSLKAVMTAQPTPTPIIEWTPPFLARKTAFMQAQKQMYGEINALKAFDAAMIKFRANEITARQIESDAIETLMGHQPLAISSAKDQGTCSIS